LQRFFVLALVLVAPLLTAGKAQATVSIGVSVSTISHGVKLSLRVSQQVYPQNALVLATLSVKNVSEHSVLMSGNNAPTVLAQTPGGATLFDASYPIPNQPVTSTPYILPWPLNPGQVWKHLQYVVVRGPYLQPVLNIVVGPSGPTLTVRGRRLHLRLFRGASPTVTHVHSSSPYVRITPPIGVRGTPHVTFGGRWGPVDASRYHWHVDWLPFDARHLAPCDTCGDVALFGYLNHPATIIDFKNLWAGSPSKMNLVPPVS
jgi:hypothetical protein